MEHLRRSPSAVEVLIYNPNLELGPGLDCPFRFMPFNMTVSAGVI